jgi:hypothetical protein
LCTPLDTYRATNAHSSSLIYQVHHGGRCAPKVPLFTYYLAKAAAVFELARKADEEMNECTRLAAGTRLKMHTDVLHNVLIALHPFIPASLPSNVVDHLSKLTLINFECK